MGGRSGSGWAVTALLALLALACAGSPGAAAPAGGPSAAQVVVATAGPKTKTPPPVGDDRAEAEPAYWLAKLEEPAWRTRAVHRLEQFYEDEMTRRDFDNKAPEVAALIDVSVAALVRTYVHHSIELDTRTRVGLLKLLANYRDPRTEPALKKAFDDFVRNPATSKEESDVKWAAQAAGELKLPGLSQPLLDAFIAMKVSTTLGGVSYKTMSEALLAVPDKAWVERLIARLEPEIKAPQANTDRPLIDAYRDQLFWQVTAAQLLGRLGDARAVDPLLRVMLDPAKADIQATAILALVRLGKPSVEAATKLLEGNAPELIAFSKQRIEALTGKSMVGAPYRMPAAMVLGTTGRSDGAPPLQAAIRAEKDPALRALFARELAKMPASAASQTAFRQAYAATTIDTDLPGEGGAALETLAESAANFHDSAWVDWLLEQAAQARGNSEDVGSYRTSVVITALKLARPAQLSAIKKAIDKYGGGDVEMRAYQQTRRLLDTCGERVACYIAEIQKPEHQDHDGQWFGIKAGYMLGVLGNEQTRDQLVAMLDGLRNPAVRYVAVLTIDHLTPHGNKAVVAKLDAMVTKNAKSVDRDKVAFDAPVKQVMYRIGARD